MKNIALKSNFYKNIGFFTHIYFVNADYVFNEKSFDEIIEFIYENPFHDVLIHTNDINTDVVRLIKEISKTKHVWLESRSFLAEDFVMMQEDTMKALGIDKIEVMIDALEDIIDLKKTIEEQRLVKFDYMGLPF